MEIVIQIIKDSMNERQIEITEEKIKYELYIVKQHINKKFSHHMDSFYSQRQIGQLKYNLNNFK